MKRRERVVVKMTLLSPSNQWEFSVSKDTGNSLRRCPQPLYYSRSLPTPPPSPTLRSLPFCAGVQISGDSIRALNDGLIKCKNIEGYGQSTTRYMYAQFVQTSLCFSLLACSSFNFNLDKFSACAL